MTNKMSYLTAVTVVLLLGLILVSTATAQATEVCYLSGLYDIPVGSSVTSIIYDPGTLAVYFERTITSGQSDPYNALLPVIVPITAVEDTYIDGVYFASFLASDPIYHLPLSDCVGSFIGDGRINDGPNELGAPLAAYCAGGGIEVWEIDENAQGILGFTASTDEIDATLSVAASSGLPTLVGSGLGNNLYASPTGELAVMGPDFRDASKTYRFDFPGNRCG